MKKKKKPLDRRAQLSNRDRLNVFLMLLMRDRLPVGVVESLIQTVDSLTPADRNTHRYRRAAFDAYVRDVSRRLWKD